MIAGNVGRTVSIAFKGGMRDMLYLSAPFGQASVRDMIAGHLGDHRLACAQLDSLRWVGFSRRREGLASPELNAYFHTSGMHDA